MPELPEVETVCNYLRRRIVGKAVAEINILETKQFIGNQQNLIGRSIVAVHRKGKYLAWELDNGLFLNIHLKMTGQILYPAPREAKHTRVIIIFTDGSRLNFNDMRKFGWMKLYHAPIFPQAPDVAGNEFNLQTLQQALSKSKRPVKTVILDQSLMAGIGNIYANDALFLAKIHPDRPSSSLSIIEVEALYKAIKQVINQGIELRGATVQDRGYILPDGSSGGYQNVMKVYQKEGEPCPTCGKAIVRSKQSGRSSFFCPSCQR